MNKTKEKDVESKTQAGDKDKEISPVVSTPEAEPKFPKLVPERHPQPLPQRPRKANQDKQFDKFLEILKQLYINISLVEALQQMSNYVKFM